MPTYGPWMDDATPVDQLVMLKTTGEYPAATWGWEWHGVGASGTDVEGAAVDAWTAGTLAFTGTNFQGASFVADAYDFTNAQASWQGVWLTCEKPAAPEVTETGLPASWDSDPNVVGVEWEPTTDVLTQRLEVTAYDIKIDSFHQRPFHVKIVDGVGTRYEPAAEHAPTMAARPDAGTMATFRSGDYEVGTAYINDPPVSVDPGGSSFAVALLDDYAQTLDTSDILEQSARIGVVFYRIRVKLYYTQRPRYRLIYADNAVAPVPTRVTPSLRMLQRGGSGGMSGIPRMVGDPTRRGIRQGPGSVY